MSKEKSAQERTEELNAREEALQAREAELEAEQKRITILQKKLEQQAVEVASGRSMTLPEVGQGKGVEKVEEFDPAKAIAIEAFMNELVTILVYPDGQPGALDVITINCNGVNQSIIRGREQEVKRKYVEILARSRVVNYIQEVLDPQRPESIQMKPIAALTYPFAVRRDNNPYGAAWLEAILKQPV